MPDITDLKRGLRNLHKAVAWPKQNHDRAVQQLMDRGRTRAGKRRAQHKKENPRNA